MKRVISTIAFLIAVTAAASPAMAQQRPPIPPKAQLPWWDRAPEQKLGNYWIKSDLPPAQVQRIAAHLNLMYDEYSKRLAGISVRAQEKLNVLLFANRDEYIFTLQARFGVNAQASGGMFFATSTVSGGALALWVNDISQRSPLHLEHVLQHEAFHQFAYSRFGDDLLPWVNEGLAEYFGLAVRGPGAANDGDVVLLGQRPQRAVDAIKIAIERKQHIAFRTMLTMTSKDWSATLTSANASLRYYQAWSMVHFLIHGEGGRHIPALESYLRHLNGGLAPDVAFTRAFGSDIEAFERRWIEHALSISPSALITALERMDFLAAGAIELARRAGERESPPPSSLAEMKAALRRIDFSYTAPSQHGIAIEYKASDEALFAIPMDELCAQPPAFLVSRAGVSRRDHKLEEVNPTPLSITTEFLKPWNAQLRWIRAADNSGFRYEIVIR